MKKVYLFIYSNSLGSREEVKNIIDSIPEIVNWLYDIPNSFFIQSENSANQIVDLINAKTHNENFSFFISEITDNRQGYLTQDVWSFINQ